MKFDQENLLNHPLVNSWINFKWYRIAIPGIVSYCSVYAAFLIFLTLFAVLIPRPGPQNALCRFQPKLIRGKFILFAVTGSRFYNFSQSAESNVSNTSIGKCIPLVIRTYETIN